MPKFSPPDLVRLGIALLVAGGMEEDHAARVAETLVEAELLGHVSHGLDLLPRYIDEIDTARMRGRGEPDTIADHGPTVLWDGGMLPGPALVTRAIDLGLDRMRAFGLATIVVRRCHHTACLAAYLQRATRHGALILLTSSSAGGKAVAPFGGLRGTYSTDPVGCGIPTTGDPILVDVSLASVSMNVCRQFLDRGERLPGPWLLDREGNPTDDPAAVRAGGGTVMPLGGPDLGYKGFALALIMEALTSGLAGHGRSTSPQPGECTVFVLLLDPDRFGGGAHLMREMAFQAAAARDASVPGGVPVRIPGERALGLRRKALAEGLEVPSTVLEKLAGRAAAHGIAFPTALSAEGAA